MARRKIRPDERVSVPMTDRERALLVEHTFADPEYTHRLHANPNGKGLVGEFTLDDLEDLLGYIAAEANHTDDKKLQKELDKLHERLFRIQRSYDDGDWNDSEV